MLVLTRKVNQSINIGDDITLTVIRLKNGPVQLGIEAPRDIAVVRTEIATRNQQQPQPVGS